MDCIWHEHLEQRLNYERNLNFSTIPGTEEDYNCPKKKVARDPMSHRIIEKRRRDRMNNCLADLSRLIPSSYLKKGRGRIEKTEIIEMAIKHLKQLQARQYNNNSGLDDSKGVLCMMEVEEEDGGTPAVNLEQYRLGYQECLSETMRFLVELEGLYPGDSLCVKLMSHLQKHCEKIVKGRRVNEFNGFEPKMASVVHSETDNGLGDRLSPCSLSQPVSHCRSEGHTPISKTFEGAFHQNGASQASTKLSTTPSAIVVEACVNGDEPLNFRDRTLAAEHNGHHKHHGDNEDHHHRRQYDGSQLREMLQNPPSSLLLSVHRGRSMSVGSSRPTSTASSISSASGGSCRSDGVYKFKQNIKERFKADQQGVRVAGSAMSDGEASAVEADRVSSPPPPAVTGRRRRQRQATPSPELAEHGENELQIDDDDSSEMVAATETKFSSILKQQQPNFRVKATFHSANSSSTVVLRGSNEEAVNGTTAAAASSPTRSYVGTYNGHHHDDVTAFSRGSPIDTKLNREIFLQLNCQKASVNLQQQQHDVPIFALHPKGGFYVPMTVDASLIVPYMADVTDCSPSILHHVGIAVYFYSGTAKIPSAQRILQDTSSFPSNK